MDKNKLVNKLPKNLFDNLDFVINGFGINNNLRMSHFLSQCSHESGHFKHLSENLNYSSEGLLKIFKKYFISEEIAKGYARNPEKIASKVYANRMGNGDEISKEGYKYRGRGYIQLTGKNNYVNFGKYINEDIVGDPDLVSSPKYALMSAGWFWKSNGLNEISDKGSSMEVVIKITKKINGGTIGLEERNKLFNEYYNLLSK